MYEPEVVEASVDRNSLARRAVGLPPTLPASPAPGAISFDSGHAFPGVLPDLTAEALRALTKYRTETLQYGPRAGLPDLRRWIAEYMTSDGALVTPENILVTNGAKHALELVCRVLLDEGDSVVVTAPTYFSAIPIFRSFGVEFVEIGQDQEGLDVMLFRARLERLRREARPLPKLIYDVPDFHNPTGITMSLDRRRSLVSLAREFRIPLVEDSPYRKVRFEGESIPSLKSLDQNGSVLQLGTFAKLMAPGLRVGWAAAPADLVARMALLKTDAGSCPLTQRIVLEFCEAGRLPAHVAQVQATYRSNRDRMRAALERELPMARTMIPRGGYYFWLTLPSGTDGDALARRAADAGVSAIAGSRFYARPDAGHPKNEIRLAYSHTTHEEIDEGVSRLARAYRENAAAGPVAANR